MPNEPGVIRTDAERLIYENDYARIFDNDVTFPGGVPGHYLKLDWQAPYGVGVLPIMESGEVLLVRAFRYASNNWSIEIPQGFGTVSASPLTSAENELREETGLCTTSFRKLAVLKANPGFMDFSTHLFAATGCQQFSDPVPEKSEVFAEPLMAPFSDVYNLIAEGTINDALTVSALLLGQILLDL